MNSTITGLMSPPGHTKTEQGDLETYLIINLKPMLGMARSQTHPMRGSGIFVYIISDILTPIHRYSYLEGSSFPVSIMKRKIDFHGFHGSFKHFTQFRAIGNSVIGMNSKNDKTVNLNFQKS